MIGTEGGANLAAETDFTEHDVFFGELAAGDGAGDGKADSEVGSGILELQTANDVDEDVLVREFELRAALEDGDEKIKAVQIAAGSGALRIAEV